MNLRDRSRDPAWHTSEGEYHVGDVLDFLRDQPDESVQCVVTSPPYWGLRDYNVAGMIGLEPTLAEWLARMVAVFDEVRRVLRADGTAWVNMGDSYAQNGASGGAGPKGDDPGRANTARAQAGQRVPAGLKQKDMLGQPWRLAFALQAAGWWLRSDIVWHKPNPMPGSQTDRPTSAHEYVFLLTKSPRYFYDAEAVREPHTAANTQRQLTASDRGADAARVRGAGTYEIGAARHLNPAGRNLRDVWTIPTQATEAEHFATFPERLVEPCILAGTKAGGVVLDPFMGFGTTALVAERLGRRWVGVDISAEYADLARERVNKRTGREYEAAPGMTQAAFVGDQQRAS